MILCKKFELKLLLYYTYQFRANNSELQIHLGSKDDELLEMKRLVEESQKEIEEVIYKYSLTTNEKLNQTTGGDYKTVLLGLYNTVLLTAITPLTFLKKFADLTAITPLSPFFSSKMTALTPLGPYF